MWSLSVAATRGCGRRGRSRRSSREARVVLLEAATCGHGPSGRNGGFCNLLWLSLPNMRRRWGDEGALVVARAAERAVGGDRCLLRAAGGRCLVPARRIPPGIDRAGPRRRLGSGPGRMPGSWGCRRDSAAVSGGGGRALRLPRLPRRRLLSRGGHRAAGAAGAGPARAADRCRGGGPRGLPGRTPYGTRQERSRPAPSAARSALAPQSSRSAARRKPATGRCATH